MRSRREGKGGKGTEGEGERASILMAIGRKGLRSDREGREGKRERGGGGRRDI